MLLPARVNSAIAMFAACATAVLLVPAPPAAAHPRPATATRARTAAVRLPSNVLAQPMLQIGGRDDEVVRWVQLKLRIQADGDFGPQTLAAVQSFQRSHELIPDGIVGPRTWGALLNATSRSSDACIASSPVVTDSFGAPRSGGRTHQGVDVMARYGSPVYALRSGTVRRSYYNRLGGLAIILSDDRGNQFYYAHQSANLVRAGERVVRGQVIGRVGTSGNARGTPPHVHFEYWPGGGRAVDPYRLLRAACG
ncbi:MAG TPA: peptidoglycan DD-metalloendopeptidase family protein [Mycobacteriales bacterium]|jgi:murein DD-endopeptidase MepM/ murein hydrolase activator NlpD|nr:peptidoglycan DD-metalloendopeptidase family protein [Mycobacteriales bacterium]